MSLLGGGGGRPGGRSGTARTPIEARSIDVPLFIVSKVSCDIVSGGGRRGARATGSGSIGGGYRAQTLDSAIAEEQGEGAPRAATSAPQLGASQERGARSSRLSPITQISATSRRMSRPSTPRRCAAGRRSREDLMPDTILRISTREIRHVKLAYQIVSFDKEWRRLRGITWPAAPGPLPTH
ncbi:hypothetical protein EVAR_45977_1 [Eumeta japonica]|uniref:Uncharacterized protein n=1 Tax=Eumeta variegata TaxID=151549 RepID=A0A4C1YR13_EUMVA|nr:hypothetical protein EVAR_45977_1 [Eumeta japonica]